MSRNTDFLFVYEVKARELETMALLTYELERRGYSVAYVNTWKNLFHSFKRKNKCKVVLAFGAYDTPVINFVLDYVKSCEKMVNMQWEQLLSLGQKDDPNSYYYIKGKAKEEGVTHFCWGQENYDRLVNECGVDSSKAKIIGHIGLDYMRPGFLKYYKTRDEICDEYNIDKSKRMLLFISSFSYVNVPGRMENLAGDTFAKFNVDSQNIVLRWFEDILKARDDITLVYRPHPAEANNTILLDMQKKYSNFRVISDYSVKQWVVVADQIYNWYSTSIMEVYMGNKSCYILRPIPVNPNDEMTVFINAEYITDYDSFVETIDNNEYYFPVPERDLHRIYYIDKDVPSYIRAANELEKIIVCEEQTLPDGFHERWAFSKRQFVKRIPPIKQLLLLFRIVKSRMGDESAKEQLDYESYCSQMAKKNYVSEKEIKALASKIGRIIEESSI